MWMNSIHNCLPAERTGVIAFLDLRQPVWGPSLTLGDVAEFLFSCPGASMFMWQRPPKGGELWCSFPPSFPPLHLLPHSCGRSDTKPWQDKCPILMVGKRRLLHTSYSQYLSLDPLKMNGCKSSCALSTSLGDSDSGRFFPILPLT